MRFGSISRKSLMISHRRLVHRRFSNASSLKALLTLVFLSATISSLPASEPVVDESRAEKAGGTGSDAKGTAKASSANYREFARGLDDLGQQFDASVALPPNSEAAGAAGRMFFRLQTLPADERYELLKAWTIPDDGRESIRIYIVVIPD